MQYKIVVLFFLIVSEISISFHLSISLTFSFCLFFLRGLRNLILVNVSWTQCIFLRDSPLTVQDTTHLLGEPPSSDLAVLYTHAHTHAHTF